MTRPDGFVYLACGRRGGGTRESYIDHDWVEQFLDPRDRGEGEEPKERKEIRSWTYYPHDPETWREKGLSAGVEQLMTPRRRIIGHEALLPVRARGGGGGSDARRGRIG